MKTVADRLKARGIVLPVVPAPVGAYRPAVIAGPFVFTSGQLPLVDGRLLIQGQVGRDCTIEEAARAARVCVLNGLSVLHLVIGDLELIEQIVKVTGYVASAEDFHEHSQVLNGASDLLVDLFGEAGKHARSAVGVASLPLCAPVEIELLVTVNHISLVR
ncbi:MAG TPA: RidA family protein [Atribacteraceae bacterium]|nr:RidA family protein [Atribacteraceae bacterium]